MRRTVVALRALGLGDLLAGLPALRGLRAAFPADRLVLAAPAWLAPVALLSGAVDEVLPTAPLGPVAVSGPDLAVNLHGRGPESVAVLLATGPGELWSFDTVGAPSWDRPGGEHEVVRWCRLLAGYGVPCDPAALDLPLPPGPVGDPAVTVVHPGGAAAARRWPAERWAAVARGLRRRGHRVVITGSAPERDLALSVAVAAGLPAGAVRAGDTDLLGFCALVACARLVVCADTGAGHLATAYRTPSVVLFGPVSPAEWGPPADRPYHRALWAGRPSDPFAAVTDPGLLSFTAADVLAAAAAHDRSGVTAARS